MYSDENAFVVKYFGVCWLAVLFFSLPVNAEIGTVLWQQKISDTNGTFTGAIDSYDYFGGSVASLGDLDDDNVPDIAVGAYKDDDGAGSSGAVWILFLNTDGTVKSYQKISSTTGGFSGNLDTSDSFGYSVASLGDLDGDGVTDIAVGATEDDDGGTNQGAVWILFLNTDGTVKDYQKISETEGGFTGVLSSSDAFGYSIASLGDLDGDGYGDIAVGAAEDDDGGTDRGAVWILFLDPNGEVTNHQKISDSQGNFTGTLASGDFFGCSVANLGDVNGDEVIDIGVGAIGNDGNGINRGAVWVLSLEPNGVVKAQQEISDVNGNFDGVLDSNDSFGWSISSIGDMDRDGIAEVAVGASSDDDGGANRGAVWVLFLDSNGVVRNYQKISDTEGDFGPVLSDSDSFGSSFAWIGDMDGDKLPEVICGASGDDDGGTNTGAVWVTSLYKCKYNLSGDVNYDCKVDLDDFGLMALNWLADCNESPEYPGCAAMR